MNEVNNRISVMILQSAPMFVQLQTIESVNNMLNDVENILAASSDGRFRQLYNIKHRDG